jgi:two-component system, response regulator, stage 0 sporulation protein F
MKTILIVENDSNQLLLYKQELQLEGYNVITARDGIDAVKKMNDYFPDLVVMDIILPYADNLEYLGKILRKYRNIPIIINTSLINYKNKFTSWSADACLTKTSDLTYLKGKIKELIDTTKISYIFNEKII